MTDFWQIVNAILRGAIGALLGSVLAIAWVSFSSDFSDQAKLYAFGLLLSVTSPFVALGGAFAGVLVSYLVGEPRTPMARIASVLIGVAFGGLIAVAFALYDLATSRPSSATYGSYLILYGVICGLTAGLILAWGRGDVRKIPAILNTDIF